MQIINADKVDIGDVDVTYVDIDDNTECHR